jgi:hypothetical protein
LGSSEKFNRVPQIPFREDLPEFFGHGGQSAGSIPTIRLQYLFGT